MTIRAAEKADSQTPGVRPPPMDLNNGLLMVPLEMDISPHCSISKLHKFKPHAPQASKKNASQGSYLRSPHQRCFQSRIFRVQSRTVRTASFWYLAFTIDQRLFFFQALPFGLSPAPLAYAKILKFLLTIMRDKQINIMAYLDDWIL